MTVRAARRAYRQKREYVSGGGNPDKFKTCDKMFCQNLDALGVEPGREYVTSVVSACKKTHPHPYTIV